MSNISCLMSNESACGLLSGVFLLGGGLGILLYQVCTIKNFVKDVLEKKFSNRAKFVEKSKYVKAAVNNNVKIAGHRGVGSNLKDNAVVVGQFAFNKYYFQKYLLTRDTQ